VARIDLDGFAMLVVAVDARLPFHHRIARAV